MAASDQITLAAPLPQTLQAHDLRELRIGLRLPVRVWGMDLNEKPFTANAETVEISALGARLTGIASVKEGEVIGIQYEGNKARFRVVWVGEPGSERAGQIGVTCLDNSKCIWSKALEAQPTLK